MHRVMLQIIQFIVSSHIMTSNVGKGPCFPLVFTMKVMRCLQQCFSFVLES